MKNTTTLLLVSTIALAALAAAAAWNSNSGEERPITPPGAHSDAPESESTEPPLAPTQDSKVDRDRATSDEQSRGPNPEGASDATPELSVESGTLVGRITGTPSSLLQVVVSFREFDEDGNLERHSFQDDADLDGNYRIDGIDAGARLTIEVRREDEQLWEAPFPVSLSAGEQKRIDIDIEPGHSVAGTLSTPDGIPLPNEELWVRRRTTTAPITIEGESPAARKVTTADDGTFRIDDLQRGLWAIGLAPGEGEATAEGESAIAVKTVYFGVGLNRDPGLIELIAHSNLEIHGRVVDENGRPRSVEITAMVPRNPHYPAKIVKSSDDGRFTIGPLLPHTYTLMASTEEGLAGHTSARPMDRLEVEPVEITLGAR